VYEEALCFELASPGLKVVRQALVPVEYKGRRLEGSLRLDILVNDSVIIEVKAVEEMNPLYKAQLFTYLRLTGKRLGILVNFNVRLIKDGITRVIR
jgi:GxxExxY protein